MNDELYLLLEKTINKLKNNELEEAYQYIIEAIVSDPNAAEPHNLLGIWYEFKGNKDLARKHYRVAYVLNPTYKASSENLERVSTVFLYKSIPINYGDERDEDTNMNKDTKK